MERRVQRERSLLCQRHLQHGRGDAPQRVPNGADAQMNSYGRKENIYKDMVPSGEDFREGLAAVITVRIPNPQFESQTKIKLTNAEVEGAVNSAVGDGLTQFFEENPSDCEDDCDEGAAGGRGPRSGAEGARSGPGQEQSFGGRTAGEAPRLPESQPGRIGAVSRGRGFGRRVGRYRARRGHQAILPLRGKILNVEKRSS